MSRRDAIADPWGQRTPYGPGETRPAVLVGSHLDGNTRLCTATAAAALKESFGCDGQRRPTHHPGRAGRDRAGAEPCRTRGVGRTVHTGRHGRPVQRRVSEDTELLELASHCHPQTLRQLAWTNEMLKTLSPRVVVNRPAHRRFS